MKQTVKQTRSKCFANRSSKPSSKLEASASLIVHDPFKQTRTPSRTPKRKNTYHPPDGFTRVDHQPVDMCHAQR